MRKIVFVTLIFMLSGFELVAQCVVSGNIINNGNEPLVYAHVIFENLVDNSKTVVMTDDMGYFRVKDIKPGEYTMQVSHVGSDSYSTRILISPEEMTMKLNDIIVNVSTTRLSEVLVVGAAHVSEIRPSMIKYKTSSLISQTGGTAGDILKNMPSVSMGGSPGHNRDIRYRGLGNAYTKVLINGRETGLSGNNRETVLDQIPAGSISHIEIHAVPGAEFQSEGINGIVNIVLKDNVNHGLHGKVESLAGNNNGLGGGISLASKSEKLNVFANYDFLRRSVPKPKDRVKTDFKDETITQVENSSELEEKNFNNHSLRAGYNYYLLLITKNKNHWRVHHGLPARG